MKRTTTKPNSTSTQTVWKKAYRRMVARGDVNILAPKATAVVMLERAVTLSAWPRARASAAVASATPPSRPCARPCARPSVGVAAVCTFEGGDMCSDERPSCDTSGDGEGECCEQGEAIGVCAEGVGSFLGASVGVAMP